jgi:hypothetical protein
VTDPAGILQPEAIARFSDEARRAVYDVIALRRDVRHFVQDRDVDDELLRLRGRSRHGHARAHPSELPSLP